MPTDLTLHTFPVPAFGISHCASNAIWRLFVGAHIAGGETSIISSCPGVHCSAVDFWFRNDLTLTIGMISSASVLTKPTATSVNLLTSSKHYRNLSRFTPLSASCSVASDSADQHCTSLITTSSRYALFILRNKEDGVVVGLSKS